MKVKPYTSIRIANAEPVVLELDAGDAVLATAKVCPMIGTEQTFELTNGGGTLNGFSFPAIQAPNKATVKWYASGAAEAAYATYVEVVERNYFPLDALRNYGNGSDDFASLPDEQLYAARQAATEVFEAAARRSFTARIGRTKDYGRGRLLVLDHNDVREVLTDGYRQVGDSRLARTQCCGPFPTFAEYVYGADEMPAEVSRAVLDLAAYMLRPSNRPIGATGESTDAGYIHFTTAGRDGATAIPEVNAAIQQFGAGERLVW